MTEIGEIISPPGAGRHAKNNASCPFCPEEPADPWTTFAGARNNSQVLAALLKSPGALSEKQSGARPKDGAKHRQAEDDASPPPPSKTWSFEAHHLISGKQALKKVPAMEAWITGEKIDGDTGYSVNNARNGIWLPSVPKEYVSGGFGKLSEQEKFEIAVAAMKEHKGQFHKGPHNVKPEPGDEDEHHNSYDVWLIENLAAIAERIALWSTKCPLCAKREDQKKKPRPSVEVHEILDRFSDLVRKKVTGSPRRWHIFISKLAYWYHMQEAHKLRAEFTEGRYTPVQM